MVLKIWKTNGTNSRSIGLTFFFTIIFLLLNASFHSDGTNLCLKHLLILGIKIKFVRFVWCNQDNNVKKLEFYNISIKTIYNAIMLIPFLIKLCAKLGHKVAFRYCILFPYLDILCQFYSNVWISNSILFNIIMISLDLGHHRKKA